MWQLGTAEQQLAAAERITHIGSWHWQVDHDEVVWSDELFRIYGLQPQSQTITFDYFLSRVHPDDRAETRVRVTEALAGGGRFHWLERIVRDDGDIRQLDTLGEAICDDHGRIRGLIGTCRDVTEDLQRERSLGIYRSIVDNVQIGLAVWDIGTSADLGEATLVTSNPAAERALGVALAERIGGKMVDLFLPGPPPALMELLDRVRRGDSPGEVRVHSASAANAGRTFSIRAFPLPGNCVGVAFEDVSADAHARDLLAIEQSVLELIAGDASLSEVLTSLCLKIEDLAPPAIASILLLDPSGTRLHHGAAPHLPPDYTRAVDGIVIGPTAGSCGTAAYLRCAVFADDIEEDRLWESYRELARKAGVRACWSQPVLASDGRVLGTFALYYREPRHPTAADLELIVRATHIAGIAIQRRQLDDQLHALSARIDAAREDERTRISREIHDVLGQELVAIKLDLTWVRRRLGDAAAACAAKLEEAAAQIDRVIRTVRRIAAELRPGVLDSLGLVAALEVYSAEFERRTGIECELVADPDAKIDRTHATALFRIFQEALTNVARHADARRVVIGVTVTQREIRFEVCDDGRGITKAQAANPWSLGLLGIRERAAALAGAAEITAASPRGTRVSILLPVSESPSSL